MHKFNFARICSLAGLGRSICQALSPHFLFNFFYFLRLLFISFFPSLPSNDLKRSDFGWKVYYSLTTEERLAAARRARKKQQGSNLHHESSWRCKSWKSRIFDYNLFKKICVFFERVSWTDKFMTNFATFFNKNIISCLGLNYSKVKQRTKTRKGSEFSSWIWIKFIKKLQKNIEFCFLWFFYSNSNLNF